MATALASAFMGDKRKFDFYSSNNEVRKVGKAGREKEGADRVGRLFNMETIILTQVSPSLTEGYLQL